MNWQANFTAVDLNQTTAAISVGKRHSCALSVTRVRMLQGRVQGRVGMQGVCFRVQAARRDYARPGETREVGRSAADQWSVSTGSIQCLFEHHQFLSSAPA